MFDFCGSYGLSSASSLIFCESFISYIDFCGSFRSSSKFRLISVGLY